MNLSIKSIIKRIFYFKKPDHKTIDHKGILKLNFLFSFILICFILVFFLILSLLGYNLDKNEFYTFIITMFSIIFTFGTLYFYFYSFAELNNEDLIENIFLKLKNFIKKILKFLKKIEKALFIFFEILKLIILISLFFSLFVIIIINMKYLTDYLKIISFPFLIMIIDVWLMVFARGLIIIFSNDLGINIYLMYLKVIKYNSNEKKLIVSKPDFNLNLDEREDNITKKGYLIIATLVIFPLYFYLLMPYFIKDRSYKIFKERRTEIQKHLVLILTFTTLFSSIVDLSAQYLLFVIILIYFFISTPIISLNKLFREINLRETSTNVEVNPLEEIKAFPNESSNKYVTIALFFIILNLLIKILKISQYSFIISIIYFIFLCIITVFVMIALISLIGSIFYPLMIFNEFEIDLYANEAKKKLINKNNIESEDI